MKKKKKKKKKRGRDENRYNPLVGSRNVVFSFALKKNLLERDRRNGVAKDRPFLSSRRKEKESPVLPGTLRWFSWHFTAFFTQFYLVLPSFPGFNGIELVLVWLHRIFLCLTSFFSRFERNFSKLT